MREYEVELRPLEFHEIEFAAGLVARAFRDLPTTYRTVGTDPVRRYKFLHNAYRAFFPHAPSLPWSAWHRGTLVGIMGIQEPGTCQLSIMQKVQMAPWFIRGNRPAEIARSLSVFAERDRHDMKEPHLHLEPVAVEPAVAGLGVATKLMNRVCEEADRRNMYMFGITEKVENNEFYKRFGCEVIDEFPIIGLPNWAVQRKPRPVEQAGQANGDRAEAQPEGDPADAAMAGPAG